MIEAEVGQQLEDVIDELVQSGRYRSKNDVLREGVRLVKEQEAHLARIDDAVSFGIADAEAGRVRAMDDVFGDLIAKHGSAERTRL